MKTKVTLNEGELREAVFRFLEDFLSENGLDLKLIREDATVSLIRDPLTGGYVAEVEAVK